MHCLVNFDRLHIVKTDDNLSSRAQAKMKPVNITVSIVDDDAPARGILAEWVRGADGFRCVGVHENAETALAALAIPHTKICLCGRHRITTAPRAGVKPSP